MIKKIRTKTIALAVSCALLFSLSPQNSFAQGRKVLLRDAETEYMLRSLTQPLFENSTVNGDAVTFALVKDSSLNAFVAGGQNIFIHTGLILNADTPEQLIGVIAHELGHIEGGHLIKGMDAVKGASAQAIFTTILGVGVGALTGNADAGAAIVTGGQHLAQRGFLSFTRTQESAADQAALKYLTASRISPSGLLEFMEKLQDQELLPAERQDEYVRTHPLSRNRVETIESFIERENPEYDPLTDHQIFLFERIKNKLDGYINPSQTLRRLKRKEQLTDPELYGMALANHQRANINEALAQIDQLIEKHPEDPFFQEFKGQILFETGKIDAAKPYYRFAVEKLPQVAPLHVDYAHLLIEGGAPEELNEALHELKLAANIDPQDSRTWRLFASVYGKQDNRPMTIYALAEEASAKGDYKTAQELSKRALDLLPTGAAAWLRAQDIHNDSQRALKK